ncbi:alpha 1,2-mannosyltransferase 2.4.1 [Mortierella sp. AD094]|nr:alpha 1,2-mannosyltransferase 2.4.1 [Mortierella sp. AD094]
MIQAPSRYARIIRAVIPFAAICGLGYLFLITFVSDRFGPSARSVSRKGQVEDDPIGGIERILVGREPQESSQPNPYSGQQTQDPGYSSAVDHEDDSDEEYMPEKTTQDTYLADQGNFAEEHVIYEVEKANGALVILTHEESLQDARETIRQVEDRFNRGRNYPWVVISPLPLTARSQNLTKQLSKGTMTFGTIPHEQWRLPKWIDAAKVRNGDYANMRLGMNKTSLLMRHKWRYMSGFVAQHELLDQYELFWRVDPGVEIFCDVEEDPMLALKKSGQKFAWSLSSAVNQAGVPGAWPIIQKIKGAYQNLIPASNDEAFLIKESRDEL